MRHATVARQAPPVFIFAIARRNPRRWRAGCCWPRPSPSQQASCPGITAVRAAGRGHRAVHRSSGALLGAGLRGACLDWTGAGL